MGPQDPQQDSEQATTGPPDGLSAFAARVLNQLTLTAWLPAAFLATGIAVLMQFRALQSADLLTAVVSLTSDPVRILVMTIPVLTITTVVTQAFSFDAIRTLEGYWRGPFSLAGALMIRWHVHRKQAIRKRYENAAAATFYAARPRMLKGGITVTLVDAMEAQLLDTELASLSSEEETALAQMNWQDLCDSWRLAKVDRLRSEVESYPEDSRVMPTKLGNLIRATEDQLRHADGDPQSFAFRRRSAVTYRVRIQHD